MSQSPDHIATHRLLMEKEAEIARLLVENAELRARLDIAMAYVPDPDAEPVTNPNFSEKEVERLKRSFAEYEDKPTPAESPKRKRGKSAE